MEGLDINTPFEIYSVHGENLFSGKGNYLDLSGLEPGPYFLKIEGKQVVKFLKK